MLGLLKQIPALANVASSGKRYTSLHQAAWHGASLPVIGALLALGGDRHLVTKEGLTACDIARTRHPDREDLHYILFSAKCSPAQLLRKLIAETPELFSAYAILGGARLGHEGINVKRRFVVTRRKRAPLQWNTRDRFARGMTESDTPAEQNYRISRRRRTTIRTSHSDPLLIAEVSTPRGCGTIGVTFCPGKIDAKVGWRRDLDIDMDVIEAWGAVAVVTLIEDREFDLLDVPTLGPTVARRHMDWFHLPIRDVSTPSQEFDKAWVRIGAALRARLRDGARLVVHCRGGLGRAGTVAARMLIDLGVAPKDAIARVRAVRPGAIETLGQEAYVLRQAPLPEVAAKTTRAAIEDRAVGALVGLAVGDALGTTLEFLQRDDRAEPLIDMVGGGPFRLRAGEWTDDTAMALGLAESLVADRKLNPRDLMTRFVAWWKTGEYSCTGACFDIGVTTCSALQNWLRSGDPYAGSTDPKTAGNGSLMRLAPAAIAHWNDRDARRSVAERQSRTTHAAEEAVDACTYYADLLAEAIAGRDRAEILAPRTVPGAHKIANLANGAWRGKPRSAVRGTGYVVDALEAALWCVAASSDFRGAVLRAANLREDADTTAAIAGQLAGAIYGLKGIPAEWRERVAWRDRLEIVARTLARSAGALARP